MNLKTPNDVFFLCSMLVSLLEKKKVSSIPFDSLCGLVIGAQEKFCYEGKLESMQ